MVWVVFGGSKSNENQENVGKVQENVWHVQFWVGKREDGIAGWIESLRGLDGWTDCPMVLVIFWWKRGGWDRKVDWFAGWVAWLGELLGWVS